MSGDWRTAFQIDLFGPQFSSLNCVVQNLSSLENEENSLGSFKKKVLSRARYSDATWADFFQM